MTYRLNSFECDKCGGRILVWTMYDKVMNTTVVSHGTCEKCMQGVVLPTVTFQELVEMDKEVAPVEEWLAPPPKENKDEKIKTPGV